MTDLKEKNINKKIQRVKLYYNKEAKKFSKRYTTLKKKFLEKTILDYIFSKIDINNKTILDMGCGDGWLSNYLHNAKKVYGIDISPKSIKIAEDTNKTHNNTFVVMDATQMKFADKTFDIIMGVGLFEYLKANELYLFFKEAYRVIKKDGIFVFTCYGDNLLFRIFKKRIPTDGVPFLALNKIKDIKKVVSSMGKFEFLSYDASTFIPTNIASKSNLFCNISIFLNKLLNFLVFPKRWGNVLIVFLKKK